MIRNDDELLNYLSRFHIRSAECVENVRQYIHFHFYLFCDRDWCETERERDGTAWFGVDGIFQYKSGKWISFYFPFNENCRHVWFTALKNGFSIFALQHKNATIMVMVTVKARSWSLASSNWKDWHEDEKKHIHTQLPTKEPSSPCTCNDKTNKMSYLTC